MGGTKTSLGCHYRAHVHLLLRESPIFSRFTRVTSRGYMKPSFAISKAECKRKAGYCYMWYQCSVKNAGTIAACSTQKNFMLPLCSGPDDGIEGYRTEFTSLPLPWDRSHGTNDLAVVAGTVSQHRGSWSLRYLSSQGAVVPALLAFTWGSGPCVSCLHMGQWSLRYFPSCGAVLAVT
jgi:hypothetical protein